MNRISLVLPYYDNPGMLAAQCAALQALPIMVKQYLELVVVDDGSPRWPAHSYKIGMPMQVFRIEEDIRWNQDAARNLGALYATGDWLLLTDMDHMVAPRSWEHLIEHEWEVDRVMTFGRVSAPNMTAYHPHPNSWLMRREMFERIGGYDERLAGYYGTDGDFKRRVLQYAGQPISTGTDLVRFGREVQPDASTTTYARKEWFDKPMIKSITEARELEKGWRPQRYRFKHHKVA